MIRNMFKKKILITIFGRIPPPVGGVTIHTERLLEYSKKQKFVLNFYDLKKIKIFSFIHSIFKCRVCHLHGNNPLFIFIFVLICKVFRSYSIITVHGDIGFYGRIYSTFEKITLVLVDLPIVLNSHSYEIGRKFNYRTMLISSFIPPQKDELLSQDHSDIIKKIKKKNQNIFCTNAFNFVSDKNGNEVYGILDIIKVFNTKEEDFLVISDPSSSYYQYVEEQNIKINSNITFLTGSHSFCEVLKLSDCYIRNTSTDGDSLSIREALHYKTSVISSNCVNRPRGVSLFDYGDVAKLKKLINNFSRTIHEFPNQVNGGEKLMKLYRSLI